MSFLKVNHILDSSSVQGPGKRFTVWVQGCSLHCHGCQNTDTWDFSLGTSILVQDLVEKIKISKVDGLTITGGEPLDQFKSTLELVQKTIKFKNIFLCTGYKFNLIIGHDVFHEILDYVDIICSGPFDESKICRSKWKGSDNQEVRYITDRGKELLKLPVYKTEYRIDKTTGNTLVTGFTLPQ
jgi:anaerobic ribonucleoside-triphosphate reductase activating protein